MNSPSISHDIAASLPPGAASLDFVARNSGQLDMTQEKIRAAGEDFESVFLSLMLKEMRNSLEGGGFFGEESSDTFGGMFDMFIGKHVAKSTPLGIADIVANSYEKHFAAAEQEAHATAPESGDLESTSSPDGGVPESVSVTA
ncbi:MAG: rod-binding protein [Planctomycetota bacterium]